jgi:LytS/YehU family sensor histidine kinase
VVYLTTFSKLIRSLFNNADKKEISLYDELETCRLYLQLEAMRFGVQFNYTIEVEEEIDLKSIFIPALIIQPFIENAIWHGIIPKGNEGKLSLFIKRKNNLVEIIVDDDGVGREVSMQNKSRSNITHQSKGVNLTQARIELDNLLRHQEAGIEVVDKKDSSGNPTGTKVVITLKIPE